MMIRKLLATTALASVIATGALAQGTTAPAAETPAAAPSQTMTPADGAATSTTASAMQGEYLQTLGTDQYLATELTGKTVYRSEAADAESAGEIENFLVGSDGRIVAAVVETSGLDDDKAIAVPFAKLTWAMGEDNEPRAVITATPEELAAAPEFTETTAADAAATGVAAPAATGEMAAADATPAPAAGETPAMDAAAMGNSEYVATVASDQYLSQNIIGGGVYGGPAADAESIGSINDLVISGTGEVAAAVVGVGGFLGIGEKNVGVPFAELQMAREDGGEPRIVLAATKEQLTAAPTFEARANDVAASETGTANPSTSTVADQGAAVGATAGAAVGAAADATGNAIGNAADATATAANEAATADTTTTASTGGATDRASMTPVMATELTAENLEGTTVYGPNDASIGEVGDIAMSQDGKIDAVIVDVGGFLGIGEKPVAVAMDNLQFMKDASGSMYLYTQFTQGQLESAPAYDTDAYAQNRDTMRLQSGGSAPATAQ